MQTRVKRLLWGGGAVGALTAMLAAQRAYQGDGVRSEPDVEGVRAANDRFYAALNRLFEGDLEEMARTWSHEDDATLMDPFGGRQEGWAAIRDEFERAAKGIRGGEVLPRDVLSRADGEMGYVACVEAGHSVTPEGRRIKVQHRATNVFRRENGEWKMVHHHTDLAPRLQKARKEAEAAA